MQAHNNLESCCFLILDFPKMAWREIIPEEGLE